MILFIAEPGDFSALWLVAWLRDQTSVEIRVVTPLQLACAQEIAFEMSSRTAHSCFRLSVDDTLDSAKMCGVVNRMAVVPGAIAERAANADRQYATDELHAFFLGWLASLECPVLNPPSPECLSGPWHSDIVCRAMASEAGLGPDGLRLRIEDEPPMAESQPVPASATRHFVLDSRLIGPLVSARTRDALIQFAQLWGGRLLQVDTVSMGDRRAIHSATSLVDFRSGGPLLARAVLTALEA